MITVRLRAAELQPHLEAHAARLGQHAGRTRRDEGQRGRLATLRHGGEQGDPLGAHRQPERDVLHQRARHHRAVGAAHCGAHAELAVGHVGTVACSRGRSVPVIGGRYPTGSSVARFPDVRALSRGRSGVRPRQQRRPSHLEQSRHTSSTQDMTASSRPSLHPPARRVTPATRRDLPGSSATLGAARRWGSRWMGVLDVVVVGGGLGGAATASVLARHGLAVLVLEREQVFRDRVRGEWLAPWASSRPWGCAITPMPRDELDHAPRRLRRDDLDRGGATRTSDSPTMTGLSGATRSTPSASASAVARSRSVSAVPRP